MYKILFSIGTRPNFIKITQFPRELKKYSEKIDYKIVHTGQHYDDKMSKVFFEQFGIIPDIFLETDGSSPNTQMANIMIGLEKSFADYKPDMVIAVGDVNSTAATALTASKMNIKVAHVESGLRSFDRSMPEELNRIITDDIADYFFVTEQSGMDNLLREGKHKEQIFFVGNTMIDTMVAFEDKINESDVLKRFNIILKKFMLMTVHRPATVDRREGLEKSIQIINNISAKYKVVFPIHPRTIKNLKRFGLYESILSNKNLILSEPLDYFSFQKLIKECLFVLTDSGGIQEETTFLQIPCLTLRSNTERPVTTIIGTNELIPFDEKIIEEKIISIQNGSFKKGKVPPLWDGKATERIFEMLIKLLFRDDMK